MNKQERAKQYFRGHFNCSQAVFTVFGTENGLTEDQCLKMACGFGGGMGKQQLTCGAVTGAMLALGLRYGKGINDPEEKKAENYSRIRELFSEFQKINGTTTCLELLKGFDMNDPDDYRKISELRLFDTLCEKYVGDSVFIAEKIMNSKMDHKS